MIQDNTRPCRPHKIEQDDTKLKRTMPDLTGQYRTRKDQRGLNRIIQGNTILYIQDHTELNMNKQDNT